jgi:hypothetical protein
MARPCICPIEMGDALVQAVGVARQIFITLSLAAMQNFHPNS